MLEQPLLEHNHMRRTTRRFQRNVQCRLHAIWVVIAGRLITARALPQPLLLLQKEGPDMVLPGQSQKDTVAVKNLAHQVQRIAQLAGPLRGDGHAPRHLGETELYVIAAAEIGLCQVIGEKAVILCRQRAGVVLQSRRQDTGSVEQHQARAAGDHLRVGAIADGDADAAAGEIRPV